MNNDVKKINCDDYEDCEGCPYKKLVDMIMYDDYGNNIGTETILFCERNGKVDDVFLEGDIKGLFEKD